MVIPRLAMRRSVGPLQIAVDGPVSAGKGTVALALAKKLKILYIDTGAMYRATAYLAKKSGISWEDASSIVKMLRGVSIEIRQPTSKERDGRSCTVFIDREDVTWKIRSEEMGLGASAVSRYPQVREILVEKQRAMARGRGVIMEGRDITTRVLPKAPFKIFLTASVKERAKRRQEQLYKRGIKLPYEKVLRDIRKRDRQDSTRAADPLRVIEGAWLLDTTHLTIQEVIGRIIEKIMKSGFKNGGEAV